MQATLSKQTLPRLDELGTDLLLTTRSQHWLALTRPFIGLACYCIAVYFGQWWLAPIIVFLIFVAVVTVTHDVVHRSLGMTQRQTAWALFLMGSVLMESGHAYRTTHVQHHKYFPADEDEDPEGYPAHIGLLGAIFYGPVFLYRLWWWAFRRNKKRTGQRVWMIVEVLIPIIVFTTGIFLWKTMPAILVYAVLALVGSWVPPSSWNSPITWSTTFILRCPATTSPNSLAASIPSSKRRVCSTGMSFREEKAFADMSRN